MSIGGIIGIVIGVVVVALIVWAVVAMRRSDKKHQEELALCFAELGIEVTSERPLQATGTYEGMELLIQGTHAVTGRNTVFHTRVVLSGGTPPETTVQRAARGPADGGAPAGKQILTGQSVFDSHFRVFVGDSAAEEMWKDTDLCADIMAIGRPGRPGQLIELRCTSGQVTVTIGGPGIYPEPLKAILALAARLAQPG